MTKRAICHSRKKFYHGEDIYWYGIPNNLKNYIPQKFLNVADTIYYEYGGTHEEAVKALNEAGFKLIEGSEF